MLETLRGKIVDIGGEFLFHTTNKHNTKGNLFPIVNKTRDMLRVNSEVECTLVCTNKNENKYKAYVNKELTSPMDYQAFIRLVNYTVTERMNRENLLYGKIKDLVDVDDLKVNTRRREVVVCRNIAIYFIEKYLGRQLDFSDIGIHYGRSRSMVYVSLKEVDDYLVNKQLYNIFKDIENEVELIYNNLKEE